MPKTIPTPAGAALRFFREAKGLSVKEFALLHGLTVAAVSGWETGRPLSRKRLGELLAPLGVPSDAIDAVLLGHRLATAPEGPPLLGGVSATELAIIQRAAAAVSRTGGDAAQSALLVRAIQRNADHHHEWAAMMWSRLGEVPMEYQELHVDAAARDERSWALAVRICNASEAKAAHRAPEALRLARLAVRLARQGRYADVSLHRLAGWCESFLANAHRVAGDLNTAEETFAAADGHWALGEGGDPAGLLDATRPLDLKASFLRQRGRFPEALEHLDRALAASPPEAEARLLIKKATTHTRAGDYEKAVEVLRVTESRIDPNRDPRLFYGFHFSMANNLAHLEQYADAERLMGRVDLLAATIRNDLDTCRTRWLRGRLCVGLGRRADALAALTEVRDHFEREGIAYDFALITLELATIHLEQKQTRRVRELADSMFWIFESQQVHEEALAALTLFCQAAKMGTAEAGWTRRLVKYLYRAQHNPKLHFED